MFISRECDYAIRMVRALSDMQVKPVRQLCEEETVPIPYAYKILKRLDIAGIVKSHRGPSGGYSLAKETSQLTMYDVVVSVCDELLINECIRDGYQCPNNSDSGLCKVHTEMRRLQTLVFEGLKEKPFNKLL